MSCPTCSDTLCTFVSNHVEFIAESCSFFEDGIAHEHDFNPRITTWCCHNGHEFTLKGVKKCTGCILERDSNTKKLQSATTNRPRAPAVPYNVFI